MKQKSYDIGGIPSDLLDSDVEFKRNFKVSVKNLEEISLASNEKFISMVSILDSILSELKLLNARTEEMGNTGINLNDIED